jgi:RNA 3'-terminal phosphate cyclase (ATP)
MITIDGNQGEGGGQILRTSLFFSLVLGEEVRVEKIRAKRENPGLRPQHLAAIRAFAEVTGGEVENAKVGASWIRFRPSDKAKGETTIEVGTAGSVTLILQSLLPAVALAGRRASVKVKGGTDTKWSPTYEYFKRVFEPAANAMGLRISTRLLRRGYYPIGGGLVEGTAHPSEVVEEKDFCLPPTKRAGTIVSVSSNLRRDVVKRQCGAAREALETRGVEVEATEAREEEANSPGSSVLVYRTEPDRCYFGGDAIGERGLPAESVGRAAARIFLATLDSGASVDPHLADMLVPLMAFSKRARLLTDRETPHLTTNLAVAKAFTGCDFYLQRAGRLCEVIVAGRRR